MSLEIKDDPKQVLVILNSLGIINVTAQELKIFLKALKLYKKIRQNNFQKWQKVINSKVFDREYIKCIQHSISNSNLLNEIINNDEKSYINYSEADKSQYQNTYENKVEQIKRNPFTIIDNDIDSKNNRFTKLHTILPQSMKSNSCLEKVNSIKIIFHPIYKQKNMTSNTTRTRNSESSFISQTCNTSKYHDSKASFSHKKMVNDPVTLYNLYKNFWKQVTIPGETHHIKLQ